MKCSICCHPNRLAIDREIVKNGNLSAIAKNFGVGYNSLYAHSKDHVSRQLTQAFEKKALEENFDLLGKIDRIITRAEDIFQRNYKNKHDVTALKALDSQRNTIELLAKISYSLHQAKVAEIELKRMEQGDDEQDELEDYQQKLSILTMDELKLYQQLVNKIETGNKSILVIPENNTKSFDLPNVLTYSGSNILNEVKPAIKRTNLAKPKDTFDIESLQVSELNTSIDLTPPRKVYQPVLKRK